MAFLMQKISNENMNSDEIFSTRDFYSSAVLLATGCSLQSVKKVSSGFSMFVFSESPEFCQQLIDKHLASQLDVKSWQLVNAIKSLKARLYQ